MTLDIRQKLYECKKIIAQQRADDGSISPHTSYYDAMAGFDYAVSILMPLLELAVRQRDSYASAYAVTDDYDIGQMKKDIEADNAELARLLERSNG